MGERALEGRSAGGRGSLVVYLALFRNAHCMNRISITVGAGHTSLPVISKTGNAA